MARATRSYTLEPNTHKPKYLVRRATFAGGYLQRDGTFGDEKTAKRFPDQDAARKAGEAALGDRYGIFPTSVQPRYRKVYV